MTDFPLGNFSATGLSQLMGHHEKAEVFILSDAHLKEGWMEFQVPCWFVLPFCSEIVS